MLISIASSFYSNKNYISFRPAATLSNLDFIDLSHKHYNIIYCMPLKYLQGIGLIETYSC